MIPQKFNKYFKTVSQKLSLFVVMDSQMDDSNLNAFGEIMEVMGRNCETLLDEGHNSLVQQYLGLFTAYHESIKQEDSPKPDNPRKPEEFSPALIIVCTSLELLSKVAGGAPFHHTNDPDGTVIVFPTGYAAEGVLTIAMTATNTRNISLRNAVSQVRTLKNPNDIIFVFADSQQSCIVTAIEKRGNDDSFYNLTNFSDDTFRRSITWDEIPDEARKAIANNLLSTKVVSERIGCCLVGKEFENKLPQFVKKFVKVHGFDTISIPKEHFMAIRVRSAELIQNLFDIIPFPPGAKLEIITGIDWVYVKGNAPACYWLWRLLESTRWERGRWAYTFICEGADRIQGTLDGMCGVRSASAEEIVENRV